VPSARAYVHSLFVRRAQGATAARARDSTHLGLSYGTQSTTVWRRAPRVGILEPGSRCFLSYDGRPGPPFAKLAPRPSTPFPSVSQHHDENLRRQPPIQRR
jgi:hypothetical protein